MTDNGLGLFEASTDIGDVGAPGSAVAHGQSYHVTGAGENIWTTEDAFHFVWLRVTGDVSLAADVAFLGEGEVAHRKACVMIRTSLEPDAAYADIAVHGDGLTSLQSRPTAAAETAELRYRDAAPRRIEIRRTGDAITAALDGVVQQAGIELEASETVYVGLAVTSHKRGLLETAAFSAVSIDRGQS